MIATLVEAVWVRRVFPSNFFDIERRLDAGPAGGGGALYIDVPTRAVADLQAFLGESARAAPDFEIRRPVHAIGQPGVVADLVWAPKSGGRRRLFQNRQSVPDPRHPAWSPAHGFPSAPDSVANPTEAGLHLPEGGLRVFVVRTGDGELHAGFLAGAYPADWPDLDDLRDAMTSEGVVELRSPVWLDAADRRRPFSSSPTEVVRAAPVVAPDPAAESDGAGVDLFARTSATSSYASPEHALAVDDVAMELALAWTRAAFPGTDVERMPHNNLGFDIRVLRGGEVVHHVEAKGTTLPEPRFFLSERERQFSVDHADAYTIVVLHGIDLTARTCAGVVRHDGAVPAEALEPAQWRGLLPRQPLRTT